MFEVVNLENTRALTLCLQKMALVVVVKLAPKHRPWQYSVIMFAELDSLRAWSNR